MPGLLQCLEYLEALIAVVEDGLACSFPLDSPLHPPRFLSSRVLEEAVDVAYTLVDCGYGRVTFLRFPDGRIVAQGPAPRFHLVPFQDTIPVVEDPLVDPFLHDFEKAAAALGLVDEDPSSFPDILDLSVGADGMTNDCWACLFPIFRGDHIEAMSILEMILAARYLKEVAPETLSNEAIELVWTDDNMLHLTGRTLSSVLGRSSRNIGGRRGWLSVHNLLAVPYDDLSDLTCVQRATIARTIGRWLPIRSSAWQFETLCVGSAIDAIQESYRINAAEMAKLGALDMFNNEMASIPKTKIRVPLGELPRLVRYLGTPILSTMKQESRNDHKFLEVAREVVRQRLDSLYPHNTDYSSVLHVGSTMTEVKRWLSHPGHDFHFALHEDKDVARVYEDVSRAVGAKLNGMTVPTLTSRKGHSTRMTFQDLPEAFGLLTGDTRKRIYTPKDSTVPKHDVLMFEDCLYSMSKEEFAHVWKSQEATVGYATMFFPNQMVQPNAVKSEIYDYVEYFAPAQEAKGIWHKVWPEILLLTPFLPLHWMTGVFHEFLGKVLEYGWDQFCTWVVSLSRDDYPLEMFGGTVIDIFKFGEILKSIQHRLAPIFRKWFCRVRVTWRGGYSNGYDHPAVTWEHWLRSARIPVGDYFVDSEIVDRVGEMYLIKFWRSTGTSDIVRNVSLPSSHRTVLVANVEDAYNVKLGRLDDLTYFPMLESEWNEIVNWGLSEPVESLNVATMMHTVRRIRGGLSVGSNVLVEAMTFDAKDTPKIALAALMYIYQKADVLNRIASDEELSKGYTARWQDFLKVIAQSGLFVATAGLSHAIWFIFKWLAEARPDYEFVRWMQEPEVEVVHGKRRPGPVPAPAEFLSRPVTVVMPHKELKSKNVCLLCEMQRSGMFSNSGVANEGQEFRCTNHDMDNEFEIGFEGAEMVQLVALIRDAKNAHIEMNATSLVPLIRKLEHFYEANLGGLKHKVKVHSIRGGPGTGKTEVIKSMMRQFERNGRKVTSMMPFKALTSDYVKTTVIGEGAKTFTFDADTTWYASRHSNVDVLIVDEMTGVDWRVIRAIACYIGAKEIYLVGDRSQTRLSSEHGEGIDPTNVDSGLDWSRIPEHDLVWNYRLNAWMVKMLNHVFGYQMLAKREDKAQPLFMTKAEYAEFKRTCNIEQEKVFAHASAPVVFGFESQAGSEDHANASIRSAQGKTFKTMAVSASQIDSATVDVHGMLCVAASRAKGALVFVAPESSDDPVPTAIRSKLCCDSPEKILAIDLSPWPERPTLSEKFELNDEEVRVDKFVRNKLEFHASQVSSDGPLDEIDFMYSRLAVTPKVVIDLSEPSVSPEVDIYDLENFFLGEFNTCFFDALAELYTDAAVRPVRMRYLNSIYWDDEAMNRPKRFGNDHPSNAFSKPLPLVKDKTQLPLNHMRLFCEANGLPVAIYTSRSVVPTFLSGSVKKDSTITTVKAVLVEDNHVTPYNPPAIYIKYHSMDRPVTISPLQRIRGEVLAYTDVRDVVEKARDPKKAIKLPGFEPPVYVPPASTETVPSAATDFEHLVRANASFEYVTKTESETRKLEEALAARSEYKWTSVASPYAHRLFVVKWMVMPYMSLCDDGLNAPIPAYIPDGAQHATYGDRPKPLVKEFSVHADILDHPAAVASVLTGVRSPSVTDADRLAFRTDAVGAAVVPEPVIQAVVVPDEVPPQIMATVVGSIVPKTPRHNFSKPSMHRTPATGMSREEERVVFRRVEATSSYHSEPFVFKNEAHSKTPTRLGTNAHLLASLIDPSGAWTRTANINEAYGVAGPKGGNRISISWQAFWHQKTKSGKLRPYTPTSFRSVAPGLANHFNNAPEENLIAADRLAKVKSKPKLNAETRAWARRTAFDVFNDLWLPQYRLDELRANYMIKEAVKAARIKHYVRRGKIEERKTLGVPRLVCSGKQQEKVIKDGVLNILKGTQVILQSPPQVNAEWIGWMRQRGAWMKEAAKPHFFMDDYEDPGEFRKRLHKAIRELPRGSQVGIMDFVEYDSQQGPVTLEIEKELARLMGCLNKDIEDYYAIRGNLSFIMFGLFKGKTNGEKGSGFLDTKLGNTCLSVALANNVFRGVGPKAVAGKGDDHLRVQTGLRIDDHERALIKAYTGMSFKCEIGQGGEFCGNSVSREGIVPSATRVAMKAICKRAANIKIFQEHQKALRNTVNEWRKCGLQEVVYMSAFAEKASPNYVQACVEFVNSLAHIDEKQWLSITRPRVNTRYHLPSAAGPVLV